MRLTDTHDTGGGTMAQDSKPKGKPRGRPFQAGFDERRKLLTKADRSKGFWNAPSRIRARIRGLYRGGKIVAKGQTVYEELAM